MAKENRQHGARGPQGTKCHCADGWICEEHPDLPRPHDDCAGPGTQGENPDCPWWRGTDPAALNTDDWDEVFASSKGKRRRHRVQ